MALDISALTSALSFWEDLGYATLAAVAIGVAGEYIHEFTELFKEFSWWKVNGAKLSILLLIAALAAELFVTIKINSTSGQIIAFLRDQEARSQLELAKLKAPRNLAPEAIGRIEAKLKPLGPRPYILAIPVNLESGSRLTGQLITALTESGWVMMSSPPGVPRNPSLPNFMLSVGVLGVRITFDLNKPGFTEAGNALADALNAEEIDASSEALLAGGPLADAINIAIGTKP